MASPDQSLHWGDWPNYQGFDTIYEERTPIELVVSGDIPTYTCGTLYRTGVGAREIKTPHDKNFKVAHWFDHLAVVHRFQILHPNEKQGKVRVLYNSRSTCDRLIERIRRTGRRDEVTVGAKYDPCQSFFQKVMSVFHPLGLGMGGDPSRISMAVTMSVNYPGLTSTGQRASDGHTSGVQTLCNKTDASLFQMLDPNTLEPIGIASQEVLHPELKGPLSATHGRSDPNTGDIFNYNLSFGLKATYRIFRVSASTGKTTILATFVEVAAYVHSLFLTEHYVILCIWNSTFIAGGLKILLSKNAIDSITWDDQRPALWYVVDRRPPSEGGRGIVAIYESPALFAFHSINAYEEPSKDGNEGMDIVCDVSTFPDLSILKSFYIDNLLSTKADNPTGGFYGNSNPLLLPRLVRYRLPGVLSLSGDVKQHAQVPRFPAAIDFTSLPKEPLCPELPTINPAYITRRHRYIYGIVSTGRSTFFESLVKYDTMTHETITWSVHGQSAGEAIFVADLNGIAEDDGVLLSVVLDGLQGRSYLLCLDARNMKEIGRASLGGSREGDNTGQYHDGARKGKVIGIGFHGTFVPELGRSVDC